MVSCNLFSVERVKYARFVGLYPTKSFVFRSGQVIAEDLTRKEIR